MSAAAFYTGAVAHRRFREASHRLRYRIAYVLVDLDRLDAANAQSRLIRFDRAGPMSVRSADHGDGTGEPLSLWARRLLTDSGVAEPATRIELVTLPRMFGFVFNPLSIYLIYGENDRLHHVLYEVNNTFGERRFYLCAAGDAPSHACAKTFYVSPFLDVDGGYRFSLRRDGDALALHIRHDGADGAPALTATLALRRRALDDAAALGVLFGFPLMTLGVVAAIHWEALKLLLKGVRYRPHRREAKRTAAFQILHPEAPADAEAAAS